MDIQYLEFFDKLGVNCNFTLDSVKNCWVGNIYLPRISAGLFESSNIFIYDKITYNGSIHLGKYQSIVGTTDTLEFRWYWKDDQYGKTPDIFLYSIDQNFIIQQDTLMVDLIDTTNHYSSIVNNRKVTSGFDHNPTKISVAINSENEGIYNKTLIIELRNQNMEEVIQVAEISVYGEVEGEDERLNDMLANFGLDFPHQDEFIFAESDPLEPKINWQLLNDKRKEMLIDIAAIKNYEMSYRGIINILRFYGYNLGIKEYWKNIDKNSVGFGNYRLVDVIDDLYNGIIDSTNDINQLNKPNRIYTKTNFLKLVYNINQIKDGEFDIENLPVAESTSEFSIEDVITKLYALKKKISEKWLPTHINIIDIAAEGDYFGKINQVSYNIEHHIDTVDTSIYPIIECSPSPIGYISDLRKQLFNVSSTFALTGTQPTIADLNSVSTLLDFESDHKFDYKSLTPMIINTSINQILNNNFTLFQETFLAYFINNEDIGLYGDNEYVPCGFLCELSVTNFVDLALDELNYPFSDFDSFFTIDNLRFGYFYEIEWIITKRVDLYSPQSYTYTVRDLVSKYEKIKLILPYHGIYDVRVNIYHLHNNTAIGIYNKFIEVRSQNADYTGYFKTALLTPTIDEIPNMTLDQLNGTIDQPIEQNILLSEYNINIDNFDQAKYIADNEIDNYTIDNLKYATIDEIGKFTIDQMEYSIDGQWVTIDDLPYPINSIGNLTIDDFTMKKVLSDMPTSFVIYLFNNTDDSTTFPIYTLTEIGNNILISNQYESIEFNYGLIDITNLTQVDDLLLQLRTTFPKYEFSPRYDYDLSHNPISLNRIVVTGKVMSDTFDCTISYWTSSIDDGVNPIYRYNNTNLVGDITRTSFMVNPTLAETDILNERKELPLYSQIVFLSDNCSIPGKNKMKWKIRNMNTNISNTYDKRIHVEFFRTRGEYEIGLELSDTNGNISFTSKPGIVKIY